MSIQISAKTDYSYLFSGLNNSNTGGSGLTSLLSDYTSIKNGTYGKLMKAYFKPESSDQVQSLGKKSVSKVSAGSVTDAQAKALTGIQKSTDQLKESADALLVTGEKSVFAKKAVTTTDENGVESTTEDYDQDAIYSAVSSFVKSYNEVLATAGEVENNSITNRLNTLQNSTVSNSKLLSRIGISMGQDGTLTLDKDSFMKASMDTVKNLFNGTGSYGYSASAQAGMMNYTADYEASRATTYTGTGAYGDSYNIGKLFNGYL